MRAKPLPAVIAVRIVVRPRLVGVERGLVATLRRRAEPRKEAVVRRRAEVAEETRRKRLRAAAVVTADHVWRGGVIAPGFPLMRDYLFERTAKLPRMALGGKCPKIGRSTEEAMRFGAWVGYRGMVREIVAELRRNFKEDFRLVATGGFARWVLKDIGMDFVIDPTLTLYGAGRIAAATRNKENGTC